MSHKVAVSLVLFGVVLIWAEGPNAAPRKGSGWFGGGATHTSTATAYPGGYDSSGISLGADYQLPFGEMLSFNPFYTYSSESSDQLADGTSVITSVIGAQFRFWPVEQFYIGWHLGLYEQYLSNDAGAISGSGFGSGLAAGMEKQLNEKMSFLVGIQYDSASDLDVFADTNIDLTGTRIHVGVRILAD